MESLRVWFNNHPQFAVVVIGACAAYWTYEFARVTLHALDAEFQAKDMKSVSESLGG